MNINGHTLSLKAGEQHHDTSLSQFLKQPYRPQNRLSIFGWSIKKYV
ncbi:hypothetical protein BSAF29S_04321 [Bacillus safensis subsp. safensis]